MQSAELGYTRTTDKSFDAAVEAVVAATEAKGFKVQHVHDVAATLQGKGFDRSPLKIVEICNAKYAHAALQSDINVSLMMPCKINVYVDGGQVYLSAMRPALLAEFFPNANLQDVAKQVDAAVRDIVDTAV